MKHKILIATAAVLCSALLSACNISVFPPESDAQAPKHYVLSDETVPVSNATLPQIPFGRISIPSYLDVPQIVTRNGNLVSRSEKNRWGEPLSRGVARNLALRCAAHAAAVHEKIALGETERIQVVFERFDGELNGNVEISALYTLIPGKNSAAATSHIFKTTVPVEAPNDYDAYVRTLSRALDALAAEIVSSALLKN
ncbi:MAG: membrane integrity-associated transporter subunit PqiC [Opitutales bacterium]|nr:membrane integrity-associated transporter subunit PqiC [Opitutales bacterium]